MGTKFREVADIALNFEQQKELHRSHKLQLKVELEIIKHQRELALDELKQKTELGKLEVQNNKFNLIRKGKWPGSSSDMPGVGSVAPGETFEKFSNLHTLTKFIVS